VSRSATKPFDKKIRGHPVKSLVECVCAVKLALFADIGTAATPKLANVCQAVCKSRRKTACFLQLSANFSALAAVILYCLRFTSSFFLAFPRHRRNLARRHGFVIQPFRAFLLNPA